MTVGERVLRRLVDRVELDDAARHDLLHDAIRLGRERGRCGTAGEIAALASTDLELRARRETGGAQAAFFRQGLWFGGVLTAVAGVVALVPPAFQTDAGLAPIVALGMIVVALIAIVGRGRSLTAVAPLAAGAAALAAWWAVHADQFDAPGAALVTTSAIALTVGARPTECLAWRVAALTLAAAALALSIAVTTDMGASDITVAFITIVVPIGLLIGSPADPRLGVAAAVALFWRFVATDPAGLGAIVVAVRAGESTLAPVMRWMVMAAAFLTAVGLTRRNLRLAAAT